MDLNEERFDICDEWGQALGFTKPRSLVHRDGDWHRSFHCWLVESDDTGEPSVLLQQRALDKETWPGLWDVSVAGHYAAGEGIEGGLREIREEIGLHVAADDLVFAARRREEVRHPDGLIDREVQDVYFLCRPIDLSTLHPDPSEVIALARIPTPTLAQLGAGSRASATTSGAVVDEQGALRRQGIELAARDLVPRADGYYGRVAHYAASLSRGQRPRTGPAWW